MTALVPHQSDGPGLSEDGLPAAVPHLGMPLRTRGGWHFLLLVEIENFAILRRQHGRARIDAFVAEVTLILRGLVDGATAIGVGGGSIEMAFDGEHRMALTGAVASIEAAFDKPVDIDGEEQQLDLLIGAAATATLHRDDVRLIEAAERALIEAQLGPRGRRP